MGQANRANKGWLFQRIHIWLALIATIPWALQGLTGAILVFEPELDAWLHRDLFYAEPTESGDRLTLDEQFEVVRQQEPEIYASVYIIDASERPGVATRMLAKPGNEVGPNDGVRLFVDPYRGEVLGTQGYRETPMGMLYHFHRTFYLPRWGRWITSTSGILLMAGALTGVALFFLRRNPQGAYRRWHRRLGIMLAPLVFVIAANGVIVTYRFVVFPLIYAATGDESPKFAPQRLDVPEDPKRITIAQAIATAKATEPEAEPKVILEPIRPGRPMTVMGRKPGEVRDTGGTFVSMNPYTGDLHGVTDFSDGSLGNQLVYATEHLHKGEWGAYFGEEYKIYTRILWFFAAMSIPVLAVLGWGSYFRARYRKARTQSHAESANQDVMPDSSPTPTLATIARAADNPA